MKLALNVLVVVLIAALIGWLLVFPPLVAGSTVPARVLVWSLIIASGLMVLFVYAVLAAMPRDMTLEPIDAHAANAEMMGRMDEAEAEGFVLAGPVLKVGMPFATALVPMVHRDGHAYATFFTIQAGKSSKTSFDIVTLFDGDAGLTTNTDPAGACNPASPGSFRQVFPEADIAQLMAHHRASVAWLQREGAVAAQHTPDAFENDIRRAINKSRDTFLQNPLGYTVVAVWRTITKTTPHIGPIADQRSTPRLLSQWRKHRDPFH